MNPEKRIFAALFVYILFLMVLWAALIAVSTLVGVLHPQEPASVVMFMYSLFSLGILASISKAIYRYGEALVSYRTKRDERHTASIQKALKSISDNDLAHPTGAHGQLNTLMFAVMGALSSHMSFRKIKKYLYEKRKLTVKWHVEFNIALDQLYWALDLININNGEVIHKYVLFTLKKGV